MEISKKLFSETCVNKLQTDTWHAVNVAEDQPGSLVVMGVDYTQLYKLENSTDKIPSFSFSIKREEERRLYKIMFALAGSSLEIKFASTESANDMVNLMCIRQRNDKEKNIYYCRLKVPYSELVNIVSTS